MKITKETVSEIKKKINEGVPVYHVSKEFKVSLSLCYAINKGDKFNDVEPKTKKQKKLELKAEPVFLKTMHLNGVHLDGELMGVVLDALRKRKIELEVRLAQITLMVDAVNKNDFSNLPPSCVKELDEMKNINELKDTA